MRAQATLNLGVIGTIGGIANGSGRCKNARPLVSCSAAQSLCLHLQRNIPADITAQVGIKVSPTGKQ